MSRHLGSWTGPRQLNGPPAEPQDQEKTRLFAATNPVADSGVKLLFPAISTFMAAFPVSPRTRKRAVLVVGPPRSGTSVVAHVLDELGCWFGDRERFVSPEVHKFLNPIFFELQSLNGLNDRILHHQQRVYIDFDWLPEEPFSPQDLATYQIWIGEFLDREFGSAEVIGLKDPRFCFTLPVWDTVLTRLGYAISYVATDRRAASVVRSNQANNRLSADANHRLYAHSKITMERHLRHKPDVVRISYEGLLADPARAVAALRSALQLAPDREQAAAAVVESRHTHHHDARASDFDAFIQAADRGEFIDLDQAFEIYRDILAAHRFDADTIESDRVAILEEARQATERQQRRYELLQTKLVSRDKTIARLERTLTEATQNYSRLEANLMSRQAEVARLEHEARVLADSTSRLLTALRRLLPRKLANGLRRLVGLPVSSLASSQADAADLAGILFHVDAPTTRFVRFQPNHAIARGWAVDTTTGGMPPIRLTIGGRSHTPVVVERGDVQQALSGVAQIQQAVGFVFCDNPRRGLQRLALEIQGRNGRWVTIKKAWTWRGLKLISSKLLPQRKTSTEIDHHTAVRRRQRHLRLQAAEISRHIAALPSRPCVSVLVDARISPAGLPTTLRSLSGQLFPVDRVVVLGDPTTIAISAAVRRKLNHQIETSCRPGTITGDFLIVLEAGEILAADACYELARAVNRDPATDLFYADEDVQDARGRYGQPFFKPAWSPDYLECFDYLGPAFLRSNLLDQAESFSSRFDLNLRATERAKAIRHLPEILCHRNARFLDARGALPAGKTDKDALAARLERTGRKGRVGQHPTYPGSLIIEASPTQLPSVSAVIPTAGKVVDTDSHGRLDLVVHIVNQLRQQTEYPKLEIIVVDNGDLSSDQKVALNASRARRVTYAKPQFNVAEKLNLGAAAATGDLLLLLNDDIIIEQADWLSRLATHFDKPHVGVAGLRLCYPDRTTQHVGVVHNRGNPDHVRRLFPHDEAGYFFSTCGVRNFMAVTGAAMLTPATVYRQVGGYSEDLAVSYNDADYCMKVRELGLSIVYDGTAELIHLESQSRVASADPEEVRIYQERWAGQVIGDPFYNERRLTVASPTFEPHANKREV